MNDELAWVTVGYVDYAKTPVGGGTYSVTDTLGVKIMTIIDNSALDVDKTDGKFKFQLPYVGKFTACGGEGSAGVVLPGRASEPVRGGGRQRQHDCEPRG